MPPALSSNTVPSVLAGSGIGMSFTDRWGGVSLAPYEELNLGTGSGDDVEAVAENRRRAALRLGVDPTRVAWMRQVHGRDVASISEPDGSRPPRVDGVVTSTTGVALAALAADCVPVLLAEPVARVIGAAHAGREGLTAGAVPAVVEAMRDRGARPGRVTVLVGPAICGRCYEVPQTMQEEVAAHVPQARCETRHATPGLDIRAGVVAQLAAVGVCGIERDPRCTAESPELYSHRRDGHTGRFAGYVWLTGEGGRA